MALFRALFLGFYLSSLFSYTSAKTVHTSRAEHTLAWSTCADYAAPLECATFQAPLDYADPSQGVIGLSVIRLPAQATPREGYMFYNPGGPGGSGLGLLGKNGVKLQAQLGSGWDILSWDPRGVGSSGPNLTLFDTVMEFSSFWNQLAGTGKLTEHGNLTQPADIEFFRAQAPAFDAFLLEFDSKYIQKSGKSLKYVGSCATVRDLVGMVDAIYGPEEDVNFYGFSYGTVIGAYLTQMFPKRVGKVILDGVLDAHYYSSELPMSGFSLDLQDAEMVLQNWAAACAASSKCPLASLGNGTEEGVMRVINGVLNTSYLGLGTTSSGYYTLSRELYIYLQSSTGWLTVANEFASAYAVQNNHTSSLVARRSPPKLRNMAPRLIDPHWESSSLWSTANNAWNSINYGYAIYCGDAERAPSNYTTSAVFEQIINVSQTVSSHFGGVMSARWFCHRWSTRAVERLGDIGIPTDFSIKPKNVVLVIGNTADPITPFSSAKKIASAERLGSMARLVRFDAIGHSTASFNSTCIDNAIHSYVRGTAPGDGNNDEADVTCEVDSTPFSSEARAGKIAIPTLFSLLGLFQLYILWR